MPDPQAQPEYARVQRVAQYALIAGFAVTAIKFAVYVLTDSAAVLSDALESIINVCAAAMMLYSVRLSNRPADRDHPYGHGKVEFVAAGLEGGMIVVAGMVIVVEAIVRLASGRTLDPDRLGAGLWCVAGISVLTLLLAVYVLSAGKRYKSVTLVADGKHLFTDFVSTLSWMPGWDSALRGPR